MATRDDTFAPSRTLSNARERPRTSLQYAGTTTIWTGENLLGHRDHEYRSAFLQAQRCPALDSRGRVRWQESEGSHAFRQHHYGPARRRRRWWIRCRRQRSRELVEQATRTP